MSTSDVGLPLNDDQGENPRVLAWAGGALFGLGLLAAVLVYWQDAGQSRMVLNAAFLLALGYPLLLYVRALGKIAVLERRLAALEQHTAAGPQPGPEPPASPV